MMKCKEENTTKKINGKFGESLRCDQTAKSVPESALRKTISLRNAVSGNPRSVCLFLNYRYRAIRAINYPDNRRIQIRRIFFGFLRCLFSLQRIFLLEYVNARG